MSTTRFVAGAAACDVPIREDEDAVNVTVSLLLLPQVSVLSVADAVRSCSLDQCYRSLLSPATSETKRKMTTFISNIKAADGATQHATGFQKAFQLLRNTSSLSKQSASKEILNSRWFFHRSGELKASVVFQPLTW